MAELRRRQRDTMRLETTRSVPRRVARGLEALVQALREAPPRARAFRLAFDAWLDAADEDLVELTGAGREARVADPGPDVRSAAPTGSSTERLRAAEAALGPSAGPRGYAAYERLFAQHLRGLDLDLAALDTKEADRARAQLGPARGAFAARFRAYHTNAVTAWASGGRRPRLVCDIVEYTASRAAAQNARATHVVWIDSLRADAWDRLRARLLPLAGREVRVLEQWLHWASPACSAQAQADLFVRGPVALVQASREPRDPPPAESGVAAASQPKRVLIGRHELVRVDAYAVARATWTGGLVGLLDLAESHVAQALGAYLRSLPSGSLVAFVGDRGFRDAGPGAPQRFVDRGGTPEEVLAPAAHLWIA